MKQQQAVVTLLQHLVQQPSLSGQEDGVIRVASEAMRALEYDEVWQDAAGNLVGVLHGKLPGKKVIFDAHTDVVAVSTPEAWDHSPFSGELEGGRVWGRGATDNKGSLAAMIVGLAAVPREELPGTVYVIGSVGEEVLEGTGLGQAVAALQPDYVIVGEPTECRLGFCQRGRARLTFRVRGLAGHSSADDQSGNAIFRLGKLIERLATYQPPQDRWLGMGIQAPIEVISAPYPSLSTVPVECRLSVDRRLVLGETEESVLAGYRALIAGLDGVDVEMDAVTYTSHCGKAFTAADFHPAWLTELDSPLVQACCAALASVGLEADPVTVPYCTNGSTSAGEQGVPTVVFGPGNIAQAHAMNEYLEIAELSRAVMGYQALARRVGR